MCRQGQMYVSNGRWIQKTGMPMAGIWGGNLQIGRAMGFSVWNQSYCWWFVRNPVNSPVEVGSWNPIIYKVLAPSQVVVLDFFHQQYLGGPVSVWVWTAEKLNYLKELLWKWVKFTSDSSQGIIGRLGLHTRSLTASSPLKAMVVGRLLGCPAGT